MESAQLLNILGNESRRTILQMLALRPCYVSEISERMHLGPKAVQTHLEMLENAGLISSKTNEQRRKYYRITENIKLEVFVSPYSYSMETRMFILKPVSNNSRTDSNENVQKSIESLQQLNKYLYELESDRRELANKQQEIEIKMTDVMARCIDRINEIAEDSLEAEIMQTILKEPQDRRELSMRLRLPEYMMEDNLQSLIERKIIREIKKDKKQILTLTR